MTIDITIWNPEVLPTKERLAKKDINIIHSERGGIEIRAKNFNDRLRWYCNNGFITQKQMRAGKRFYVLWFFGSMKSHYAISRYSDMPSKTFEAGTSEEIQEAYINARSAINGVKPRKIAFDVCCIGDAAGSKGRKSNMDYLRSALDDLVKHFGYDNEDRRPE